MVMFRNAGKNYRYEVCLSEVRHELHRTHWPLCFPHKYTKYHTHVHPDKHTHTHTQRHQQYAEPTGDHLSSLLSWLPWLLLNVPVSSR